MKRIILILFVCLLSLPVFAGGKRESSNSVQEAADVKTEIVASTSWTAAFADLAGVEDVISIAPASLRHPPEYEVTVSDIETINNASVFIFAGFERMMKTLGDAVGDVTMVKITCDNSIETVKASASTIAEVTGTQAESEKRVAKYISEIEDSAQRIKDAGLANTKVLCNKNQIYLAKDLGFDVVATFGPGPVTSEQIADAESVGYDFIIDNVHNPVGSPLVEVSPNSKYLIWRNFPETIENDALLHVIQANIAQIFE